MEVEVNGQIISGGCQNYNQLWQLITDSTMGADVGNRRKIMQNGTDSIVPVANQTNVTFAIQNWLGFISSVSPNIIDTSLLGNVRIRITLTSPAALVQSVATTGAAFSFSNIFFSIDTLDISDGIFHQIHDQFLQSGGIYELPFNNYFSFSSTGGLSQTTKFSLSTQSLNRVWACFVPGGVYKINAINAVAPGTVGTYIDPQANCSSYFTRLGGGSSGIATNYGDGTNNSTYTYTLNNYQFSINNVFFPNFQPSPEQAYSLMLNSYNLSGDVLGGGYPSLNTLSKWVSSFWFAEQRFDHGSDGVALISGIDTRGSVAQAYFQTTGSIGVGTVTGTGHGPGNQVTCLVFAQTTSTLRVGAGRQLELVL